MTKVIYIWRAPAKKVDLRGSFTSKLCMEGFKLEYNVQCSLYFAIAPVPDGPTQYKFFVDGRWITDLAAPTFADLCGNHNNCAHIPATTDSSPHAILAALCDTADAVCVHGTFNEWTSTPATK